MSAFKKYWRELSRACFNVPVIGVEGDTSKSARDTDTKAIINAIVDLKTGETYVGRTIKNPYVRSVEHRKSGDPIGN